MTIELCCHCDEPTGRAGAGDDSLYDDEGIGPYCEQCFDGGDDVNDDKIPEPTDFYRPPWWRVWQWKAIARRRRRLLIELLLAADASWEGGHDYHIAANRVRDHLRESPRC